LFDAGWVVVLLRAEERGSVVPAAQLLMQLEARFAGRWSEKELVLVLDLRQADGECEQIKRSELPVSLGMVNGRTTGSFADAEAIISAARRNLTQTKGTQ
jgi:hypothetical protein